MRNAVASLTLVLVALLLVGCGSKGGGAAAPPPPAPAFTSPPAFGSTTGIATAIPLFIEVPYALTGEPTSPLFAPSITLPVSGAATVTTDAPASVFQAVLSPDGTTVALQFARGAGQVVRTLASTDIAVGAHTYHLTIQNPLGSVTSSDLTVTVWPYPAPAAKPVVPATLVPNLNPSTTTWLNVDPVKGVGILLTQTLLPSATPTTETDEVHTGARLLIPVLLSAPAGAWVVVTGDKNPFNKPGDNSPANGPFIAWFPTPDQIGITYTVTVRYIENSPLRQYTDVSFPVLSPLPAAGG